MPQISARNLAGGSHALGTSARCWDFGRPSVGADDLGGPSPVHRKKDGFPRRSAPRNDRKRLSLRGGPQGQHGNPHPPSPKAPLCKGSWHGAAVTEGLPEVDDPFWGNLRSDSHPSLATAPQTLRCAPLAWVVTGTSPSPRRGGPVCPPVNGSRNRTYSGRHIGRPLRILLQPPSPPGDNGRGRSPAPTRDRGFLIPWGRTGHMPVH